MIKVGNIPCTLDEGANLVGGEPCTAGPIVKAACRALGVHHRSVEQVILVKRSVDARRKSNVHFVLTLAVRLHDPSREEALIASGAASRYTPYEPLDIPAVPNDSPRPIVVGTGPAGLFAALYLARAGARPIVLERGGDVEERAAAVRSFGEGGRLDPQTNVQFGEGGAGTFSDGKLTTNTKHPMAAHVLEWFVQAGAPREILWEAKPHIGSDRLPGVVACMRRQIVELGGDVRFHARLADVALEGGRLCSVDVQDGVTGDVETIPARQLVLACGHSARDTFEMLLERGLAMEQKPFAIGVRIEHRQKDIDRAQWGDAAGNPALGAADYKMVEHVNARRSAYTFCMCPGGTVVCAASEEGGVVTNGMSDFARDGDNANAALLVNVEPSDFGSEHPLAGAKLQRRIEQSAYRAALEAGGAAYQAPAQTVGDFLSGRTGGGPFAIEPTYARGAVRCNLRDVLPPFVCETICSALPRFDAKLHGFASPDAVMTAPETRSSSPVRIVRDDGLHAVVRDEAGGAASRVPFGSGIYPCGEGAGYAGGIMSAAADGLRVAQAVAFDLREYPE